HNSVMMGEKSYDRIRKKNRILSELSTAGCKLRGLTHIHLETRQKSKFTRSLGTANSIKDEVSGAKQHFEQLRYRVRNRLSEQIEVIVIICQRSDKLRNFGPSLSRCNRCKNR